MFYILFAVVGYFCGCIQSGYILGKMNGIDIREHGSKNAGATNVAILVGKKRGFIVAALDILKAAIPMMLIRTFIEDGENLAFVCGFFAVIGHVFPVFLGFRGGKGTATIGGVMLGLSPWFFIIGLAIFIGVMMLSNYMVIGALSTAASLIAMVWIGYNEPLMIILSFVLLGVSIYKHIENIKRLFRGEEVTIRHGWTNTK
jgi:acyl phosphate:glycerol-3-phosphate acyltransferase